MLKQLALVLCAAGVSIILPGCKPKCDSASCATGCCDGGAENGNGGGFGNTGGGNTGGGNTGGGNTGGGNTGGGNTGGGNTGGGGGGGTDGGTLQFCTDYADAYVSRFVRCGFMTAAMGNLYKAFTVDQCTQGDLAPPLRDGRVVVNAAAFQACLMNYTNGSCETEVQCDREDIFEGTVGLMGSCFDDLDCQDAFYCDAAATCPGRCVPRIALGQRAGDGRCVKSGFNSDDLCVPLVPGGQSCAPMGASPFPQHCASPNICLENDVCGPSPTRSAVNGPCMSELHCALGLQCVNNVCVALGTLNGACDARRRCQQGLTCGPAGVCEDAMPRPLGSACRADVGCVLDALCEIPMGMTTGTCVVKRTEGAPCTDRGGECAADLVCSASASMSTGVCRQRGALNAPCSDPGFDACQPGLYCTATFQMTSGVCVNKKGGGAPCTYADECLSFSCSSSRCGCSDPTP